METRSDFVAGVTRPITSSTESEAYLAYNNSTFSLVLPWLKKNLKLQMITFFNNNYI